MYALYTSTNLELNYEFGQFYTRDDAYHFTDNLLGGFCIVYPDGKREYFHR